MGLEKKKDTVNKLKNHLKESILAVNIRYQGVTVAELEEFRTSIPSDAKFTVAKNSLIRIASNDTDGWSEFGAIAKLDSGVLVVKENVGAAIKGIKISYQKHFF